MSECVFLFKMPKTFGFSLHPCKKMGSSLDARLQTRVVSLMCLCIWDLPLYRGYTSIWWVVYSCLVKEGAVLP